MGSDQIESPSVKGKKNLKPKELTIMIIRSVGRIRSFTVSRRFLLWASIFITVYIIASVYIFSSFVKLRFKYISTFENLKSAEEELEQNRKRLIIAEQYVLGLEEHIRDLENRTDKASPSSPADREETGYVDITEITVSKGQTVLDLDFRLINTVSGDSAAEGYIHIFAGDSQNRFPAEWNYRGNEIKDGMPVNFDRGQPFLIQRFKPYHRQFEKLSEFDLPYLIRILVYDRSGTMLMERDLKVSDFS